MTTQVYWDHDVVQLAREKAQTHEVTIGQDFGDRDNELIGNLGESISIGLRSYGGRQLAFG